MAEDRKTFKIKDGHLGEVKIADEVVGTGCNRSRRCQFHGW